MLTLCHGMAKADGISMLYLRQLEGATAQAQGSTQGVA